MSKGIELPDITFNKPEPKVKGAKGTRVNQQRLPSSVYRIELGGLQRTLQGLEHAIEQDCSFDKDYAVSKMHQLNHSVTALQIAVNKAKDMDMVLNVSQSQIDGVKARILEIRPHLEAAF
tara:strand:- start:23 stop:382 length:360 start_codon:yes stop_codon:yes gene_type:complete